jgi:phosphatidylglycerol:prolipoprotein diacylglycerol transferase
MQANPPAWAIKYPEEILRWNADVPADLERLESLFALKSQLGGPEGWPEYGAHLIRLMDRGNEAVIDAVQPLLTAYYPSQLVQALTDGPLLFAVLVIVWLRPRKPGVLGSWFLVAYGVLRISSEFVRQPDEGVALLMGLSRGQVLSVLMVLAGIVALVITSRRDARRMGGWPRPEPPRDDLDGDRPNTAMAPAQEDNPRPPGAPSPSDEGADEGDGQPGPPLKGR